MKIGKHICHCLFSLILFKQMVNSGLAVFVLHLDRGDDGWIMLSLKHMPSHRIFQKINEKNTNIFQINRLINFGWRNDDVPIEGDFQDADDGFNDAVIIAIALACARMAIIFYHAFVNSNVFQVNDRVKSNFSIESFLCPLQIYT